jgi:hypothetical protein
MATRSKRGHECIASLVAADTHAPSDALQSKSRLKGALVLI